MSESPWAFAFSGKHLLVRSERGGAAVPSEAELSNAIGRNVSVERVDAALYPTLGRDCVLIELGDDYQAPQGYDLIGLRALHALLPEALFRMAGTARQKIDWVRTHQFCSRCGSPARRSDAHEGIECPECGQMHFPRLAPAVIVLIQRGREALLGRSHRFKEGVYSTLAGFVEPGESLEECVHREIEEEVGVQVENLRYFGSQPHPFPHSLMVGFIADWASGEIRIEPDEIEDAAWFTPETLPRLPHEMSIARALIDDFVRRVGESEARNP